MKWILDELKQVVVFIYFRWSLSKYASLSGAVQKKRNWPETEDLEEEQNLVKGRD